MHVERHGICLENAPRKRKKEDTITFMKRIKGMLKWNLLKMENPS
jgi:hypothetical protein